MLPRQGVHVEVELGRLLSSLRQVLLVQIAQRDDLWVAEQRVVVEIELGVEREHASIAGENQRVDLGQRGIALVEGAIQARARSAGPPGSTPLETPIFRAMPSACTSIRPSAGSIATLWIFSGACAATSSISMPPSELAISVTRCEARSTTMPTWSSPPESCAPLLQGRRRTWPPLRSGLMRHQGHAEDLRGVFMHLVERLRHFDAAALAPASGMDLRLDHPHLAAQPARCRIGLRNGEARGPPRGRDTDFAQDLLCPDIREMFMTTVLARAPLRASNMGLCRERRR